MPLLKHILAKSVFFGLASLLPGFFQKAAAQFVSTKDFEFTVEDKSGKNFHLITLGPQGIICLHESEEFVKGGNNELFIYFLDRELNLQWQTKHLVKPGTSLVDHSLDGPFLYLLLLVKEGEYETLRVNTYTGELAIVGYDNFKEFLITYFQASGHLLLFGGHIKNLPALMAFDMEKGRQFVFPTVNQLKAEITEVVVDHDQGLVNLFMYRTMPPRDKGYYINRYDFEGRLISNAFYQPENDVNLLTLRCLPLEGGDDMLVLGSYARKNADKAQGMYSLLINQGEAQKLNLYSFSSFKFFFNHLKPKKRERLLNQIDRAQAQGRDKNHGYSLFVHGLSFRDNEIILFAESYDPVNDGSRRLINRSGYPTDAFGGYGSRYDPSLWRYMRAMDGFSGYMPTAIPRERLHGGKPYPDFFRYNHAFACGFDSEGKLLWDNAFAYKETTSAYPVEYTQILPLPDSLVFLHTSKNDGEPEVVKFKTTAYQTYTDSVKTHEIPVIHEGDVVDEYNNGGLIPWFGNYFVASGIKRIRNKKESQLSREVFFVRRVGYDPGLPPK